MDKDLKTDFLVVQDNLFARGIIDQGVIGQKILLSIISCIEQDDDSFKKYEFNGVQFSSCINSKTQDVHRAINSLVKSTIKILDNDNSGKYSIYPIFACIQYDPKGSKLTAQLNSLVEPFLLQLKNNFTKYYLRNIVTMKSMYSIKLYNILKSESFKNVLDVKLDELKLMLSYPYDSISDVKRRVLNQAKKEINLKTDILIEYEFIKSGRKVVAIRFYIEDCPNKEQELFDKGETFNN